MQVEDLNILIKFYASEIWKRIEELDRKVSPQQNTNHLDQEIMRIKQKYQCYSLTDEKELEYVAKMNRRIIQIFSFFKWKSKNQFLLNLIEHNLHTRLLDILERKSFS